MKRTGSTKPAGVEKQPTVVCQGGQEMSDPIEEDCDLAKELRARLRAGELQRKSSLIAVESTEALLPDGMNEEFFTELRRSGLPPAHPLKPDEPAEAEPPLIPPDPLTRVRVDQHGQLQRHPGDDAGVCVRSSHQFVRVRPLHLCATHSFVCFRENGDLVAVTQQAVLIYGSPPAACELNYKEPMYSIPVSDVTRVADLNDNSVIMLRLGSFQTSEERASDELLIAEVATNSVRVLAKIGLHQSSVLHRSKYMLLKEASNRRGSADCRGMQVNRQEHKVYLLYDHHLMVLDLDMRLEPVVVRLQCRHNETGDAVALLEFDHAVYILTARSWLLACNKATLFTLGPSSCCLTPLLRLDSALAAHEIRSYVTDRLHCAAFFSVPRGRKLVSARFPVYTTAERSGESEDVAFEPVVESITLRERLYSAPSCSDWAAAVPCAMAWDATTEQLLVLEWGAENNGILISVEISTEEISQREQLRGAAHLLPIRDQFPVVKTFSRAD